MDSLETIISTINGIIYILDIALFVLAMIFSVTFIVRAFHTGNDDPFYGWFVAMIAQIGWFVSYIN